MKKVLFATTALVASAGIASAEVAISGAAKMGIVGGTGVDVEFFQDIDVTFKMSGETDNGLSFGAAVDLDEAGNGLATEDDDQGVAVFISGSFGTLTMGDTDGAMDWALTEGGNVANPGSIADEETSHAGYAGSYLDGAGDGQIVRYNYTFNQFSFAASVEQDDAPNDARGLVNAGNGEIGFALGAKATFGDINVGAAYQKAAGSDAFLFGGSANYTISGITAGVMFATGENAAGAEDTIIQVGAGYSMDAISVHANFQQRETAGVSTDGFGLSAKYDLGGASIHGGYNSDEQFSLGIAMSF